jgi:hypothetical protein
MLKKFIKFFILPFFLLFVVFISIFTFDSSLRRTLLTYVFVTHDYYQLKRLTNDLQVRNFDSLGDKLDKYISVSKKFSKEKSFMLPGIYEAFDLVMTHANDQQEFNFLENSLIKLVDMAPELYKPKVWLAMALSDNDYKKSIKLLDEAITLSPTQEDAYRELIRIAQINGNLSIAKKYCTIYPKSQIGGNQKLPFRGIFGSYNLKKFAVKFENNNDDNFLYYHAGIKVDNFYKYELVPQKPIHLNGLNLYFSFLPGINIQIKNITLYSKNINKTIDANQMLFSSKFSYFEKNNEYLSILSLNEKDDVVKLIFNQDTLKSNINLFNSIDKVEILMNFNKMNLTNKNFCD